MTTTDITREVTSDLAAKANRHLWGHFARHGAGITPPIITRGEGVTIWDDKGKSYIDGLSGLFVVQVGHGRKEFAEAAAKQAETLSFFPLWSYATPTAIELAERIAGYAPGDLNRVFFTTGGGEAVESAWKLAKNYFKLTGKPGKYKVISRSIAYHGTPQGALAITGLPAFKAQFEPLTPGGFRAPNTNFYRAPAPYEHDAKAFGQYCADRIAEAIEFEGPDTVAAVFLEPVQNAGGCFPPPPGYFERVREICDEYDVLLVSDEVICAYGRIGSMFACDDFGYVPDIITSAKGLTSGYSPLGAMIASDRLFEPFNDGKTTFAHGYTFGGHPVSSAVALANLDIFEREGINDHVKEAAPAFRATLEKLYDLPIVGDVRGEGFFYGIELVKDKATKETFNDEESERLLRELPDACAVRGRPVLPRRRSRRPSRAVGAAADQRAEGIRRHLRDPARGSRRSGPPALIASAKRHSSRESSGNRLLECRFGETGQVTAPPKPPVDPVRWQPPPVDPLPDVRSAELTVVPVPGNAPEDVVVDADGNIWTGVDDGRIVRDLARRSDQPSSATPGAAAGSGRRPRRAPAGVRQSARPARDGHRQRQVRGTGRGGRRQALAVLLERHPIARRHNLFHRVDECLHLRPLQGGDTRGATPRQPVPTRSRRHRADRRPRAVFRQWRHTDGRRVGAGVRRDAGTAAGEVLAHRSAGRHGHDAGGQPARPSRQHLHRR